MHPECRLVRFHRDLVRRWLVAEVLDDSMQTTACRRLPWKSRQRRIAIAGSPWLLQGMSDGDVAEHPQELLDQSPREFPERGCIGSSIPTPDQVAVQEDHQVLQDSG